MPAPSYLLWLAFASVASQIVRGWVRRNMRAIVGKVASRRVALPYRRDLLSYLVCAIRCIYVTEVANAANGMISTVAIELPSH